MDTKINWGIIATGNIAGKFCHQFKGVNKGKLMAVGSRFYRKEKEFAQKFGIDRFYGSYEECAGDPDVDVIYIATPHNLHYECICMCLEAGKAVLCEKPFTLNYRQTKEVITLARRKQLFLMEAMWMRFNPAIVKTREYIASKTIGKIVSIYADFGFFSPFDRASRLYRRELGGGALLDIGVYPISFAVMLLGKPSTIKSVSIIGETGVDEQNAILFQYTAGQIAQLSSGFRANTNREAYVYGTEGCIKLDASWHRSLKLTLFQNERREPKPVKTIRFAGKSQGLHLQANHVIECLDRGLTESPVMPLAHTLLVMEIMDKLRAEWGVEYPLEKK